MPKRPREWTTGGTPMPHADLNKPIRQADTSYADNTLGKLRSRRAPTPFDRGASPAAPVLRPLPQQEVSFRRTAEDRKPAREIVTAKLLGDPPADLEFRRANPGLPKHRRK